MNITDLLEAVSTDQEPNFKDVEDVFLELSYGHPVEKFKIEEVEEG